MTGRVDVDWGEHEDPADDLTRQRERYRQPPSPPKPITPVYESEDLSVPADQRDELGRVPLPPRAVEALAEARSKLPASKRRVELSTEPLPVPPPPKRMENTDV